MAQSSKPVEIVDLTADSPGKENPASRGKENAFTESTGVAAPRPLPANVMREKIQQTYNVSHILFISLIDSGRIMSDVVKTKSNSFTGSIILALASNIFINRTYLWAHIRYPHSTIINSR